MKSRSENQFVFKVSTFFKEFLQKKFSYTFSKEIFTKYFSFFSLFLFIEIIRKQILRISPRHIILMCVICLRIQIVYCRKCSKLLIVVNMSCTGIPLTTVPKFWPGQNVPPSNKGFCGGLDIVIFVNFDAILLKKKISNI